MLRSAMLTVCPVRIACGIGLPLSRGADPPTQILEVVAAKAAHTTQALHREVRELRRQAFLREYAQIEAEVDEHAALSAGLTGRMDAALREFQVDLGLLAHEVEGHLARTNCPP